MMKDPLEERILAHVADRRYQPCGEEQLAAQIGVVGRRRKPFAMSLAALVTAGRLAIGPRGLITLPPPPRSVTGLFRRSRAGFGFVTPDAVAAFPDVFVPGHATKGAMSGDLVRVTVTRRGGRDDAAARRYAGRVVEILQRSMRPCVGVLRKNGGAWEVHPDNREFTVPLHIGDPGAKGARARDKVVVEIVVYPIAGRGGEAVITEVLGRHGHADAEIEGVIRSHGLIDGFSIQALEAARRIVAGFEEGMVDPDRVDMRDQHVLTIDPPSARDFDDAISIRCLEQAPDAARFELGVHIADVSHFVRPGSPLDSGAAEKGNSVYLPGRVLPMLPELLSNGICSLQEKVDRFCKSVFIRYGADGEVIGQRFEKTMIRSDKRLTYREAQALIDGHPTEARKHAATNPKYPAHLVQQLKMMHDLAQRIETRRLKEGMIVLALPSVDLVFDEAGRVIDVAPEDNAYTHKMIEMFMVEANEASARLFDGLGVPMVRRIHAAPPPLDLQQLRQFARVAGHNIPQHPSREELQALLQAVSGHPSEHAVHLAVLKTMSRAEYATASVGHFALASEHYTHFTSPIRRYPDLIVHRGLDAYLDHRKVNGTQTRTSALRRALLAEERLPGDETLDRLCSHCSTTERTAEAAERDLRAFFVLTLLEKEVGIECGTVVTGVTNGGVFLQIDGYLVESFVSVEALPGDDGRWRMNTNTGSLVALGSGRTIAIGDRFQVQISDVDPPERRLDVVMLAEEGRIPNKSRRKPRKQPRGATRSHGKTMQTKRKRKKARSKR